MKPHITLLAKIYFSTAIALTALFAAAGWFLERQASAALHDGVEQEVRSSMGAIDASWQSRAEHLATASGLLASMSDVRAAFGTRDQATIRDTAQEFWKRAALGHGDAADAAFAVADPSGTILASVGDTNPSSLAIGQALPATLLDPARREFPKQSAAFAIWDGVVWRVLTTPVYVDSGTRASLLNILIAAHPVTAEGLHDLKQRTAGSDFLLRVGNRTAVSTLAPAAADEVVSHPGNFAIHRTDLSDGGGSTVAELWAVRSFTGVEDRVRALRRTIVIAWLVAMTVGLALSYWLARRIVRPIRTLTHAAQKIGREDYSVRVPEFSNDELGVLARTFNRMSASIEESRAEQVRTGQITAVGRLAASIAHDLRNPLAAVVGGAEMLAEFDLPPDQMKQTGAHIHKAARRMEQLLSEIGQVARSAPGQRVRCTAEELVTAAIDSQQAKAAARNVIVQSSVPATLSVQCERSRVERVLVNLIANAIEVLPGGGRIEITGFDDPAGNVWIQVRDDGPGVPVEIRGKLFQPFVTAGKKNGLGLGLALARQAMLDQGGDLELVESDKGACFQMRLPKSG